MSTVQTIYTVYSYDTTDGYTSNITINTLDKGVADWYISKIPKIFPEFEVRVKVSFVTKTQLNMYREVGIIEKFDEERLFGAIIQKYQHTIEEIQDVLGIDIRRNAIDRFKAKIKTIAECIREAGPSPSGKCLRRFVGHAFSPYYLPNVHGEQLFEDIGYISQIMAVSKGPLYLKFQKIGIDIYEGLYRSISALYFPMKAYTLPKGTHFRNSHDVKLIDDGQMRIYKNSYPYQTFLLKDNWVLFLLNHGEYRWTFEIDSGKHVNGHLISKGGINFGRLFVPHTEIPEGTVLMSSSPNAVCKHTFKSNNRVDMTILSAQTSHDLERKYTVEYEEDTKLYAIYIGDEGNDGVYLLSTLTKGPGGLVHGEDHDHDTWIPPAPPLPCTKGKK